MQYLITYLNSVLCHLTFMEIANWVAQQSCRQEKTKELSADWGLFSQQNNKVDLKLKSHKFIADCLLTVDIMNLLLQFYFAFYIYGIKQIGDSVG